eukprot:gene14147-17909_t
MAFGEVFAALETHAIDGQENPLVTIDTSKLYEVQKHVTLTRHAYTPFLVLYSKKLWDQLSAEEQKTRRDGAIGGRDEERKVSRELNDKSLANLKAKGMQVSEVGAGELAKMRESTQAVYQRHQATIGKDTIERIQADLARLRGKRWPEGPDEGSRRRFRFALPQAKRLQRRETPHPNPLPQGERGHV